MKKLLVIMAAFPGIGSYPRSSILKYLPKFGVEPVVITNEGADSRFALRNCGLSEMRIYKVHCMNKSPFRIFSKVFKSWKTAMYFEHMFFVPDLYVNMVPGAVRIARKLIENDGIGTVLTSSPPESVHLAGQWLKSKVNIRWIADFRDLWTTKMVTFKPPTRLHDRFVRSLERRIYSAADIISANTNGNRDVYLNDFRIPNNKIMLLTNCYDPEEIARCVQEALSPQPGIFRVGYMGHFDKDGFPYLTALEAIRKIMDLYPKSKCELHVCGAKSVKTDKAVRNLGLTEIFKHHGLLSHFEAIKLMRSCNVQLMLHYEYGYSKAIVPHKLYHYIALGIPIWAICEKDGEAAHIINQTRTGHTSSAKTFENVFRNIHDYYTEWARTGMIQYHPSKTNIEEYSATNRAERLAQFVT